MVSNHTLNGIEVGYKTGFVPIANLDHMEVVVELGVVEGLDCIVDFDCIGIDPNYIVC
ncbi:MAG: hypothetical protein MJE68_01330 [Proteobacteria bacterium]|nr:hypothetical protein [Pseudomonadota bacterium]